MIETFLKYNGSGMMLNWFLVAWVYLLICEKKKQNRILFIYAPAVILVLFFNPLFFKVFSKVTEEAIYFRFLWLIPTTTVIGYAVVRLCNTLQGAKRICFAVIALVLMVSSGKLVYTNPLFSKAENPYHVPQEVVEICDTIKVEGREVMAAFPEEFILYVRQYSPLVCMPYGREVYMGEYNELHVLMRQEEIVVEELAALAKQYSCHYVILSEDKLLEGDMADYEYEVFGKVGEYVIYRDTSIYLGL